MTHHFNLIGILSILFVSSLLVQAVPEGAPAVDPAVAKMRDMLKSLTTRVTEAESAKATLEAEKLALEEKSKTLEDQVKKLTEQSAKDKTSTDKALAKLNDTAAAQKKEILELQQSLEKWKAEFKKSTSLAESTEAKRAKLADQVIQLDRKVLDRETKNLELYKLGNEILTRYKNYGLGRALLAHEPFTGLAKVKLQALVEEYADKLQDSKIKPSLEKGAAAKPTTDKATESKKS